MANCVLTNGIPLTSCQDNIGGLKAVYISAFNDANTYTLDADNIITLITTTETFYTFKFRPQTANFTEEGTISIENGTTFYTQLLALIFHKMDATKRKDILLLAKTLMLIIAEDNNGTKWVLGKVNGCDMTAAGSAAGQAYGDLNGYNIAITGMEPVMANEIDQTAFDLLTIAV